MEDASLIHAFWYNINFRTYEEGNQVRTFSMADYERVGALIEDVSGKLRTPDESGAGRRSSFRAAISHGGRGSLHLPPGPAAVRRLEMRLKSADPDQALQSTVLEIQFDDERTVWCPIGDFTGSGVGLNPFKDRFRMVSAGTRRFYRVSLAGRRSGKSGNRASSDEVRSWVPPAVRNQWKGDERRV